MPRKKSSQARKNAEPSMRRQSNRVAATQAVPTVDGTESNSVAVNNYSDIKPFGTAFQKLLDVGPHR
jgi:hypothetical protein